MVFFEYDFLLRSLLAGLLAGFIAPLVGQFLVVRRMPLLADTLAHTSLVGVAGALILGVSPLLGAGVVAILAALGMEKVRTSGKVSGESVLALFLSGGLALAIVLASFTSQQSVGLFSYLFGSITSVSSGDLWLMLFLAMVSFVVIGLFFRQLVLVSWQEELAEANGLRSRLLSGLLLVLSALAVVLSLRVVGVLLIGALMVIPVNMAMLFKKGFLWTSLVSILVSLFSVVAGLWLSYHLNLPPGALIVIICLVLFGLSFSIKKIRYG